MAAIDVQNILSGLMQGQTRRRDAFNRQLDQQKADQENEYRQGVLKQEQADLQQRGDIAAKNLAVATAVHNLALAHSRQELLEKAAGGQPIAGGSVTPGYATPANIDEQGNAPTQQVQLPQTVNDIGASQPLAPVTTPSPSTFATNQANLARITQGPELEATQKKQQQVEDAQMARTKFEQEAENRRNQITTNAANFRNQQSVAAELHKARLSAGMFTPDELKATGSGAEGTDMGFYQAAHEKLANGTLTEDDLKDLKPAIKQVIKMQAIQSGSGILNKTQTTWLQDLGAAASTIPKMLEFLQLQPESTSGAGAMISHLKGKVGSFTGDTKNKDLNNAEREIKSKQASLTRTVSGIARLAVPEIKYQENSSLLDQNTPRDVNAERVGQFIGDLHTAIQQKLGNLSPGQVASIEQTYGLDKWQGLIPQLMSKEVPITDINSKTGKLELKDPKTGKWLPIQ